MCVLCLRSRFFNFIHSLYLFLFCVSPVSFLVFLLYSTFRSSCFVFTSTVAILIPWPLHLTDETITICDAMQNESRMMKKKTVNGFIFYIVCYYFSFLCFCFVRFCYHFHLVYALVVFLFCAFNRYKCMSCPTYTQFYVEIKSIDLILFSYYFVVAVSVRSIARALSLSPQIECKIILPTVVQTQQVKGHHSHQK